MPNRLRLVQWIARKCGIAPGYCFPKWMLVIAYLIMPERIPVSRALSPIKYEIESDSIVVGKAHFSCHSLIALARLDKGKKFMIESKDFGVITVRFLSKED